MRVTKLLFVCLTSAIFAIQAFANMSGAVYSTNATCAGVDSNRYLWKEDVYINGGPNNDHSAGFTPGTYYVQVTTPDGTPLGVSNGQVVTVGGDGRFDSCYQLSGIVQRASNPSAGGYDTSPNGVYKVWVSASSSFDDSESKTDNFTVDNPHVALTKSCTPDAFVNDTFTSTVTATNTGSIPLTNFVVVDSIGGPLTLPPDYLDTLGVGQSYTWTVAESSVSDGPFASNDVASGDDDYFSYSAAAHASCATNVWSLAVTKTAATSYTRDWHWSMTKTPATTNRTTIEHASFDNIGFVVTATATAVDSGWTVSGTVTVHNPAPIAATLSGVSDTLSDATPVALQCPGSAPFTIAGGGDLVCSYSIGRGGPDSGSTSATATLSNNNGGSTGFNGSVAYAFGDPTTVLHALATITDGGATVDAPGWSLTNSPITALYGAPNGGSFIYNTMVNNASADCDTYANVNNTATLSDGDHTISASASAPLYSGACGLNCTLTIGYWKTHAGFTGRNADRLTSELPQWLGNVGGLKSVFVNNASGAVGLLSMSGDASNGINKLYAQMLAAKLNIVRGASPSAINSILGPADSFLASNDASGWAALSKTAKTQVNNWASTFDAYNNGTIGPGHCN